MQIIFREEALSLGTRYGLGEFVRCHQGLTLRATMRKMAPATLYTAVFLLLLFVFIAAKTNIFHLRAYALTYIPWDLLFLLLLWGGVMLITVYLQRKKRTCIYEFTGGMIEVKKQTVLHILDWEHIAALTYTRPANLYTLPSYTITMLNGKKCTLYCASIVPSIERAIACRELPKLLARYEAGETLNLGPISVNKKELARNMPANKKTPQSGQSLKWSEVRQCLSEGQTALSLAHSLNDRPWRLSLYGVSNAGVLREMLTAITSPFKCA